MSKLKEILGAVYRKELNILEKLTPKSANIKDEDGRTLLMHAILAEDADPFIVKLLIDKGSDVNIHESGERWTSLHFAARDQNEPVVRILLEAGAEADSADAFGNTPLWRSITKSKPGFGVINELIKHGADPCKKNNNGVAPIDVARKVGRADLVALFETKEK
ncbi:MAG: uncharacterized protein JWP44_3495 [Mucilaginibacter sp.]|nr:uncharacterized protein [Mucilaginibacter sp.]